MSGQKVRFIVIVRYLFQSDQRHSQTMTRPIISLLIPFRGRHEQARCILTLLGLTETIRAGDIEVIGLEVCERPKFADLLTGLGFRHLRVPDTGIFHKSRVLNLGLDASLAPVVAPFDVDLVPARGTMDRLRQWVPTIPQLLFSGYRLMSSLHTANSITEIENAPLEDAKENCPSALRKILLSGERFGVVPAFQRDRLIEIGGWDEQFVGWGCEDQEIIERYVSDGRPFVTSPDLLYFHLRHDPDPEWAEPEHIRRNRAYYYAKRTRTGFR